MKLKYYSGAQVTSIIEKLPSKEYLDMLYAFAKEPSADVVEVVRCKDCSKRSYTKCPMAIGRQSDDDYCSRGERRDDEESTERTN